MQLGAGGVSELVADLSPEVLDVRKKLARIVAEFQKRCAVELGHRALAVVVSPALGTAIGLEPGDAVGINTAVGPVVVKVVSTT